MTHTHTPAAALEAARNHYAAALAAHDHLSELYRTTTPHPREVAALQDSIRFGLKAGELAAHIAIAADLVDVAADITRERLAGSTAGKTAARVRRLNGEEL